MIPTKSNKIYPKTNSTIDVKKIKVSVNLVGLKKINLN